MTPMAASIHDKPLLTTAVPLPAGIGLCADLGFWRHLPADRNLMPTKKPRAL